MSSSDQRQVWKAQRLCRQVEEVLALALAGCGDAALLGVRVRGVAPAPTPGRLLVLIEAPDTEPIEALRALGRAQGLLRREIAAAIRRKRTPELVFRWAPSEA